MKNTTTLKIYNEFDEHFVNEWQKLYVVLKGNYNLSSEWCSIWFKHFKKKDKKLFIYTIWEKGQLKLVAPFYLKSQVLYLIGSKPDFYDEFNILSTSDDYKEEVVNDIFSKKLKVDFRIVNPENNFIKIFLRKLENEKEFSRKIYYSTIKTRADSNFEFSKSFSKDIRSKITKFKNKYKQKPFFEFEIDKKVGFLEEMLGFHKKRWSLFRSKDNELFIKDVYYNTDLLLLSRLSHENTEKLVEDRVKVKAVRRKIPYDI